MCGGGADVRRKETRVYPDGHSLQPCGMASHQTQPWTLYYVLRPFKLLWAVSKPSHNPCTSPVWVTHKAYVNAVHAFISPMQHRGVRLRCALTALHIVLLQEKHVRNKQGKRGRANISTTVPQRPMRAMSSLSETAGGRTPRQQGCGESELMAWHVAVHVLPALDVRGH